jgi:hypothetical protein
METRIFFHSCGTKLVEIPYNEVGKMVEKDQQFDNWFFAQMLASVRTAFMTYNMPVPKYIFIDRAYRGWNKMQIFLVRDNIKDEKEALKWANTWLFIQSDLEIQARANSDEDNIIFEFKII